jgi:hypothetical protein
MDSFVASYNFLQDDGNKDISLFPHNYFYSMFLSIGEDW